MVDDPPLAVMTKREFCELNRISPSKYRKLVKEGRGPKLMLKSPDRITWEEMLAWREKRAADAAIVNKELEEERRERMTALGRKSLDGPNHISKQKGPRKKSKKKRRREVSR